jgi:hypothetical protein
LLIGFKHLEFRSRFCHYKGPVVIHAGSNWYTPALRMVVIEHFRKYGRQRDEAVQALFPLSHPVADAIVEDCKPWTEGTYALSLTQVRILTRPKTAFNGMLSVPWFRGRLRRRKNWQVRSLVLVC